MKEIAATEKIESQRFHQAISQYYKHFCVWNVLKFRVEELSQKKPKKSRFKSKTTQLQRSYNIVDLSVSHCYGDTNFVEHHAHPTWRSGIGAFCKVLQKPNFLPYKEFNQSNLLIIT